MKYILGCLMFLQINLVHADPLTMTIISSALLMEDSEKLTPNEQLLRSINSQLPKKGEYSKTEFMEFNVPKDQLANYESYFLNKGYDNVSIENEKLHFDFTGHSELRKEKDLNDDAQNKLIIIAMAIIIGVSSVAVMNND